MPFFLLLIFFFSFEAKSLVFSSLKNCSDKSVVLTFDDGPAPVVLDKILMILSKYKIPATFFVLGERAKNNPDSIRKIIAQGHQIGHHSYDHKSYTKLSQEEQKEDFLKTLKILKNFSEKILWFRPPYGAHHSTIDAMVEKNGLHVVMWSIDSHDWKKKSPEVMIEKVLKELHKGGIILLHDIHAYTAKHLEKLIQAILKKGYSFIPLQKP